MKNLATAHEKDAISLPEAAAVAAAQRVIEVEAKAMLQLAAEIRRILALR